VKNGFYPSESDINAIFRRIDIDKDGRISFDEFKKIITFQDYSKITGLKDEELNPNLQSYNNISKLSVMDSHNKDFKEYLSSNHQNTTNDLEVKNSHSSFRNNPSSFKKERVDFHSFNFKTNDNPIKEENKQGNKQEDNYSHKSNNRECTLEREFNKASPNKNSQHSHQNSRLKNNNSSFMGSSSSFLKKNYILLEEEAFQEMLRDIIDMNKEIELLKCDLAVCNDFNLLDSFRFFQSSNRDYLFSTDLKNGLSLLEIPFSEEEVEFFINRFDCSKSRVIS